MKTPWFSRSGPSHSPGPAITSEESGLEEPSAHLAYCANLSCTAERFMLTVFFRVWQSFDVSRLVLQASPRVEF